MVLAGASYSSKNHSRMGDMVMRKLGKALSLNCDGSQNTEAQVNS